MTELTEHGEVLEGERIAEPVPIRAILVHLSGALRGTTQVLTGRRIRIGTGAHSEVHFPADKEPAVAEHHAELRQDDSSYDVVSAPGELVRLNGERIDQAPLTTGDVLEIGDGGPFLRFRLHRGAERPYKRVSEALSDCLGCARKGATNPLGKLAILLSGAPRELLTQTRPASRAVAAIMLVALLTGVVALAVQGLALRRRMDAEEAMLREISELLEQGEQNSLTEGELEQIRADLEAQLAERLEALEERSLDARRVISEASR